MVGYCKAHAKGKDLETLEEFTGKENVKYVEKTLLDMTMS